MWRELQAGDPELIGPYRLRGLLGTGGMGRVFLGVSAGGRPVAVKVIRADLAADAGFRTRFQREVDVARRVSGQFTAPVIDADLDAPEPWLATAYVPGPSLADAVRDHGPLPAASVLRLAAGLAEGLCAIHAAGVVHRDLKPANVLLAEDGPRLIDFGISLGAEASALTRTGLVIGSPGFMSPEQAAGRDIGPASDIFSLGAILAFAATGEGPFGTGSTPALVYRVVHTPPSLDHVPAELRPLVSRCLAKEPGRRPTAVQLLAEAGAALPAVGGMTLTASTDHLPAPHTGHAHMTMHAPKRTARPTATQTVATTPTASATPTPTAAPTMTATPTPTATPTMTATAAPTMTVNPTMTASPATATPTPAVTQTASIAPAMAPTATASSGSGSPAAA